MKNSNSYLWLFLTFFSLTLFSCSEEAVIESLQKKLDRGDLPEDLISKRKYSGIDFIGLEFQGGVIYAINPEGQTWIVGAEDLNPEGGSKWGCVGIKTGARVSSANGDTVYTVQVSNQRIVDAGCLQSGDAARLALNYTGGGYDDWLLPTIGEHGEIILKLSLTDAGKEVLTGFGEYYWAANEPFNDLTKAFVAEYVSSNKDRVTFDKWKKDEFALVRPIRVYNPE